MIFFLSLHELDHPADAQKEPGQGGARSWPTRERSERSGLAIDRAMRPGIRAIDAGWMGLSEERIVARGLQKAGFGEASQLTVFWLSALLFGEHGFGSHSPVNPEGTATGP